MARRSQKLALQFPIKGYTENTPYSQIPEGFTPDALNVVSFDPEGERMRGSKRAGTGRLVANPVDADGTAIQRLGQVTLSAGSFIEPGNFFDDADYEDEEWGWPDPEILFPDDPDLIANADLLEAGTLTVL